jgi:uncharacterized protein YhfF
VGVIRLAEVDVQHALDEGEGDESVAQCRDQRARQPGADAGRLAVVSRG